MSNPSEHDDRDVPAHSLNLTDISPVQASLVRKFFLRETGGLSQRTNVLSNHFHNIGIDPTPLHRGKGPQRGLSIHGL